MQKNIKEKLSVIFTLEFWLLGIPFLFAALVSSLFIARKFSYLKNFRGDMLGAFLLSFIVILYLIIRICKTRKNDKEKSLINFLKTRSIKLIFLSIFVFWQYFNFTGFCYKEMRYLSDKELIDKIVTQQFVMQDKEKREEALNHKCPIIQSNLTESELSKKFTSRKCKDSKYSSWEEFFKNDLDQKCPEDLEKYSTEKCGIFYYSSIEIFYNENPNCCKLEPFLYNLVVYERSSNGEPTIMDIIYAKLYGFGSSRVEMNILKKRNDHFTRNIERKNNPPFPYLHAYFGTDYCGNVGDKWIEGVTKRDYNYYIEKSLMKKDSQYYIEKIFLPN